MTLLLVLRYFYNHSLSMSNLNHAMVCLIPEEQEAKLIQKFRPISLVDCCNKMISKILTNRLQPLMNDLVDHTQIVFIKDRYVLINVLAAHELIHYVDKHKQKRHNIEGYF
jgi:Reverse transcriptase (RNA-dependent DNA polymerase)